MIEFSALDGLEKWQDKVSQKSTTWHMRGEVGKKTTIKDMDIPSFLWGQKGDFWDLLSPRKSFVEERQMKSP